MFRIKIIEDKNGGELIVKDKTSAPLNFAAQDIRSIASRKGAFSKTITLAPTKANAEKLGFYFKVNVNSVEFDVNKKLKVQLFNGNTPIEGDFYLQLTKINRKNNRVTGWEVFVKGEVSDFFTVVNQRYLDELDFSDGNHYLTNAEVLDRLPKNYGETVATYHLTANVDNSYELSQFKPAFFALDIWNRIHQRAGRSYTWDSLADVETQFDKLIIPTNKKEDEEEVTLQNVVAERSLINYSQTGSGFPTALTLQPFTVNTEILDVNNLYNPTTGVYQSAINIPAGASVLFNLKMRLKHEIKNNEAETIGFTPTLVSDLFSKYKFSVLKNGGQTAQIFAAVGETPTSTTIAAGATHTVFDNDIQISLAASNFVTSDLMSLAFGIVETYNPAIKWIKSGGTNASVTNLIECTGIELEIVPNGLSGYGFGKYIDLNKYIPKKIKQSDFIQSVMLMYNLIVDQEQSTENNIVYVKRDQYYDSGEVKEWKLDRSKEYGYTFLSELTAKKKIVTYKEDKDTVNEAYKNQTNEVYGQVEYTFKSDFVKGIDTTELIFSPTPIIDTSFGAIVPALDGISPDSNIRILYKGDLLPCAPYTITEFAGSTATISNGYYPCTHFDNPIQPNFDLNFSTCDFYFYPYLQRRTNNNLFNLNWRRQFAQIDNGRMLEGWFLINELELKNIRLNHKIYTEGQYWNINKIIDVDLENSRLTKCELISVEDLQKIPVRIRRPRPTGAGGVITPAIKELIGKVSTGLNSLPYLSNIQVFGKNVVVDQTVQNAIIVGNNVQATEDGVYTPKIVFPDGTSIESTTSLASENLGNTDLVSTGNRTFDANGFTLDWIGLTQEKKTASAPPLIGNASFEWKGNGTTSADKIATFKNGAGSAIVEMFGDKNTIFYGSNGFNTYPNGLGHIMVDSAGAGISGILISGTTTPAIRADIPNASCFVGNGQIGVNLNGSLYGVYTTSAAGGFGVYSGARAYFESYGYNGSAEATAAIHVNSNTQGALPIPRMNTAQKNAISSPATGLMVFDTNLNRYERYDDFWGWIPLGSFTPDMGIEFWDELVNTSPTNYFVNSTANGGTAVAQYLPLLAPQAKLWGLSTGTATNGESRHLTANYFMGSVGKKEYETKVCPSVSSDSVNRFIFRAGYVNLNGGLTLSPGMYFLYDEGGVYGTATASTNWLCVCNTATGLTTIVNSGVPVKFQASNSMQKLKIKDYGTGNKVEFYIDGVLVATITTNVPLSTIDLFIGEVITKQAGTTNRSVYIDYSRAKEKFNTSR